MTESELISGTTSTGVPFVARATSTTGAPVIAAWHLLDPPRTPAAFAAALPLAGLDATVLYLGLPLSGDRMPDGGFDEIMRLAGDDAVMRLFAPILEGAVAEFPAAFAELCERFDVSPDAAVGLLGGSAGSAVAAGVLASGTSGASAAVFVSPMLQLAPNIDAMAEFFGGDAYAWHPESRRVAAEMDFVARAEEITATDAALRVIVGLDDEPAFVGPARLFAVATGADLQLMESVAHALAEEPGIEPAPQTEAAAAYDALAVEWFSEHLR
ncbi:hypothetical protein [Leifsonia sp. Leaf264]|uniref:hypothetical protein n=1 Tax=Leifsonia sp. Leaf264 TaxID=1736314 RepID=UPI0006FC090B|nr:hypothetical protein [Leifsonia sp. Leaf264]KQO97628.1 hypothetical protein ASF30_14515 [Leifsonia sp. Leaf264]